MKIEFIKEDLSNALLKLERITIKNPTLPVLKCVLFNTNDEKLITLKSTNLDIGLEIKIQGKVIEKGETFTVPGDVVTHLITNISDKGKITLEKKNGDETILIKTKNTSTKIKTYPHEDFPNIPKTKGEKKIFNISSSLFEEGIKSVIFNASVSNIKPELASVYMYEKNNSLYFVATDFFRLSEKKIKTLEDVRGVDVLIPYKNTQNIIKLLDFNEDIKVSIDENQISLKNKKTTITSRIVNGDFPDYQQIIPKEYKSQAVVLKEDLISAFKINSIFSGEFKQVKFIISKSNNKLTLETNNSNIGINITDIEADVIGENMEIKFNHRYISECLPYFKSESIVLGFSDHNKPLTIKGVDDESFLQLIMPMNK